MRSFLPFYGSSEIQLIKTWGCAVPRMSLPDTRRARSREARSAAGARAGGADEKPWSSRGDALSSLTAVEVAASPSAHRPATRFWCWEEGETRR